MRRRTIPKTKIFFKGDGYSKKQILLHLPIAIPIPKQKFIRILFYLRGRFMFACSQVKSKIYLHIPLYSFHQVPWQDYSRQLHRQSGLKPDLQPHDCKSKLLQKGVSQHFLIAQQYIALLLPHTFRFEQLHYLRSTITEENSGKCNQRQKKKKKLLFIKEAK